MAMRTSQNCPAHDAAPLCRCPTTVHSIEKLAMSRARVGLARHDGLRWVTPETRGWVHVELVSLHRMGCDVSPTRAAMGWSAQRNGCNLTSGQGADSHHWKSDAIIICPRILLQGSKVSRLQGPKALPHPPAGSLNLNPSHTSHVHDAPGSPNSRLLRASLYCCLETTFLHVPCRKKSSAHQPAFHASADTAGVLPREVGVYGLVPYPQDYLGT